jgi:hypothetical protein
MKLKGVCKYRAKEAWFCLTASRWRIRSRIRKNSGKHSIARKPQRNYTFARGTNSTQPGTLATILATFTMRTKSLYVIL